ncbi:hypothetical protein RND71_041001 [Anisodus tanguticus]|uniref:Uncharacterized protein n=1 Tax=Anisodus tanguticus TaxID=243964 RepID=A0AAE1QTB1_9SOLA|nr:hypothetical protein RND71_041001 [Anisodus tanguticus]
MVSTAALLHPIITRRLEISDDEGAEEPLVSNVEDVLNIVKSDYEKAYFVTEVIVAYWKLRTSLKLPWRPLISVYGNTVYTLDEQLKIVKHVESWK